MQYTHLNKDKDKVSSRIDRSLLASYLAMGRVWVGVILRPMTQGFLTLRVQSIRMETVSMVSAFGPQIVVWGGILHIWVCGPRGQDKGDSRNHGLQDPYIYIPCAIHHFLYNIYTVFPYQDPYVC